MIFGISNNIVVGFTLMQKPTLMHERKLWKKGVANVAGVDEVGRGALAGPVVAAAVVFFPGRIPDELHDVRDSKTLTAAQRERLYGHIKAYAAAWAVASVSRRIVDRINIANASIMAMHKAVTKLRISPERLLIDGRISQRQWSQNNAIASVCDLDESVRIPFSAFVKGDGRIFSISAASIIAKVARDRIMRTYHQKFPQYGLHKHKGYGTSLHYKMLRLHGPCVLHRRSFYLG